MQTIIAKQIKHLCDTVPPVLRQFSEEQMSVRPAPGKWSKKELLGHLIDSAANNHQRFVRMRYLDTPEIFYDQNIWVDLQNYQSGNPNELISLWEMYNRHLAWVIENTPEKDLSRTSSAGDQKIFTLGYQIEDYLSHLEHHLKQLLQKG